MSDLVNVWDFQDDIVAWAGETFPNSTIEGVMTHLLEEVDELKTAIDQAEEVDPDMPWDQEAKGWRGVAEECADVMHLLFQVADRHGFNLVAVTQDKFEINKRRTWGDPDADGVVRHVENAS